MAVSLGVPATCATWSSVASGSATARLACSGYSRASTSPGRRPGRSTPRPILWRRSGMRETAARHPEAARVELWFMDEARVGQKGRLTHVWYQKGVRPRGVRQQGFVSAHLFGAVCPERGEGVALVLPEVSTAAMDVFLAELSRAVPAGTHAALVLDGAGWHVSEGLTVPANLTLVPLPPYSPEWNPVERVWEHLRDRWRSHRVLAGGYEAVVDAACAAWNALLAEPGRLRSLTNFPWLPASVTTS